MNKFVYTLIKTIKISSSHYLNLNHNSKDCNLHGHNYIIKVFCRSESLDEDGVVCDCSKIKNAIVEAFDHKELNKLIPQPTMENIAKYVFDLSGDKCFKVEITETENNKAVYEK